MWKTWIGWTSSLVLVASGIGSLAPRMQAPASSVPPAPKVDELRKVLTQAVTDYAEGIYSHDVRRLERCVHPSYVRTSYALHQNAYLETRMDLLQFRNWVHERDKDVPAPPALTKSIAVLEALDQTGSAKLVAPWGVEHLHLAKSGGKWLVIHSLAQSAPNAAQN